MGRGLAAAAAAALGLGGERRGSARDASEARARAPAAAAAAAPALRCRSASWARRGSLTASPPRSRALPFSDPTAMGTARGPEQPPAGCLCSASCCCRCGESGELGEAREPGGAERAPGEVGWGGADTVRGSGSRWGEGARSWPPGGSEALAHSAGAPSCPAPARTRL